MATTVQRFYIGEGALLPALEMAVTKESDGTAYDFTNHSAPTFSMRKTGLSTSILTDVPAAFKAPVTLGVLRHDWIAGETDISGIYKGQFSVLDSANRPIVIPNGSYIEIHIIPRINT
jgi:hypothetical protein